MKCIVVTPEKTEVETEAAFVAIPLFDGEYGVAPLHTPMVGRLGAGELRIKIGEETESYYIEGGFVEVSNDVVSILTSRLLRKDALSLADSEEALAAAHAKKAGDPESMAEKFAALRNARARIRVARKWS
ncbi:MAG: F0F1 ATP synthase subunit epsilon [Thermoguttaceae bacterium]|nr:F0F1 ATP synthase subunit epsilon [Thermoguttaceae bacterium]